MSDTPQGPGWWQASDDKWYPPPRPEMHDQGAAQPPHSAPSDPHGQQPGPYGPPPGMPPGQSGPYGAMPPGQHSNRTAIFVGAGIAGAMVLLLGLFLILDSGDDGGDDQTELVGGSSATTEDTLPPDEGTVETPPTTDDGGGDDDSGGGGSGGGGDGEVPSSFSSTEMIELENGLQIAEYGFSNAPGYWDEEEIYASYGVVIENTGGSLQEDVSLIVTARAEDGSTLGSENHEIHFVDAGGTMAIGHVFDTVFAPIDELDFSFGGSSDGGSLGSGGIDVTSVTTTDDGSSLSVTFGVDNNYNYALSYPWTTAIVRDTDGGIIGGDSSIIGLPSNVPSESSTGGDMTLWMAFETLDIDPDGTDLWVYFRP